mmetsp:Transcript_46095/g.91959  ORF Transcript_46095/g.91959 Transcript_46095/m.91959 type:complete len:83 (+) Transcript_46095:693-941(+)
MFSRGGQIATMGITTILHKVLTNICALLIGNGVLDNGVVDTSSSGMSPSLIEGLGISGGKFIVPCSAWSNASLLSDIVLLTS